MHIQKEMIEVVEDFVNIVGTLRNDIEDDHETARGERNVLL